MKLRIAIWLGLGALVVVAWRVYISVTLSNPLGTDGVARALVYLTCPIAMASQHPQGFYFVLAMNAATYALAGVVVETMRRYHHIRSNPN
jgi:TRAP-type C4-dicarboxylate transport system permease small subunit